MISNKGILWFYIGESLCISVEVCRTHLIFEFNHILSALYFFTCICKIFYIQILGAKSTLTAHPLNIAFTIGILQRDVFIIYIPFGRCWFIHSRILFLAYRIFYRVIEYNSILILFSVLYS